MFTSTCFESHLVEKIVPFYKNFSINETKNKNNFDRSLTGGNTRVIQL